MDTINLCLLIVNVVFFLVLSRMYLKVDGVLRIDRSDKNKDLYLFEVKDIDKLANRKKITIRVDNKADLSQK